MPRSVLRAGGVTRVSLQRRRVCGWLLLPATQYLFAQRAAAATVGSARMWPATEYTRLILEAPVPMAHQLLMMKNPYRIVLDLEDVELSPELAQLPQRVLSNDPYVRSIRVAVFRPGVVRVVLDLKAEVNPQLFALLPAGEYGHRLVLDLYPLTAPDPLMALLEGERNEPSGAPAHPESPADKPAAGSERAESRSVPDGRRRIVIAIDPGHGGEDPGAIGRRGTYEKDVALAIARKLKTQLDAEPGMRAMLTRDDDYFVPLQGRVQKARQVHADRAGVVGVRPVGARRDQRRGGAARAARERVGFDRRGQPEHAGSDRAQRPAGHVANGADQR